MPLPILLAVEDEPAVNRDLERDLAKRYRADYEVVVKSSPGDALEALSQAQRTATPVALMIASLRLREMAGIDFIMRGHELHPLARRALLVGVSDSEAVGMMEQAFTLNRVDSYLTKPWDPADEWLHPTVAELLREWVRDELGPRSAVIQLIGDLWEPRCYRLKDLLDRNGLPYAYYPADS
ncbi:MAG TPA: fused response regulator/thioredoxin-disulfide reductase, partial [Candidatus Dormibacteraeota bacterium]|nr:fused response regulator/thioredoxin-disulfide reductase [Candidatus Dormibacteraeota bacterium]